MSPHVPAGSVRQCGWTSLCLKEVFWIIVQHLEYSVSGHVSFMGQGKKKNHLSSMDFCICDALKMILAYWGLVFDEIKRWPFLRSCSNCALVIEVHCCLCLGRLHHQQGRAVFVLDIERRTFCQRWYFVCKASWLTHLCVGSFCDYIILKVILIVQVFVWRNMR